MLIKTISEFLEHFIRCPNVLTPMPKNQGCGVGVAWSRKFESESNS